MIRTAKFIFCDNEHGTGNITFPEISRIDDQTFIEPRTVGQLRKQAKAEGWTRNDGADYCPACSEIDPLNYAQN